MIKLNRNDLLKLAASAGHQIETKKKTRTSFDRLNDATEIMNQEGINDKIYFNADSSVCIIEFRNVAFLSNNDLLRIDNRDIYKFKMAWHERVHALVKKVDLSAWEETKKIHCSSNSCIKLRTPKNMTQMQLFLPLSQLWMV